MGAYTKKYLKWMVGARVYHPSLGEFVVTGVNCDYLFVRRNGEESISRMSIDGLKIRQFPGGTDVENQFLKVLEEESGMSFDDVKNQYKTRKREYKEFRYFHLLFRNKIMRLSLAQTAEVYKKDHATTLHDIKTLINFYNTDKGFQKYYNNTIQFILTLDENALT